MASFSRQRTRECDSAEQETSRIVFRGRLRHFFMLHDRSLLPTVDKLAVFVFNACTTPHPAHSRLRQADNHSRPEPLLATLRERYGRTPDDAGIEDLRFRPPGPP